LRQQTRLHKKVDIPGRTRIDNKYVIIGALTGGG